MNLSSTIGTRIEFLEQELSTKKERCAKQPQDSFLLELEGLSQRAQSNKFLFHSYRNWCKIAVCTILCQLKYSTTSISCRKVLARCTDFSGAWLNTAVLCLWHLWILCQYRIVFLDDMDFCVKFSIKDILIWMILGCLSRERQILLRTFRDISHTLRSFVHYSCSKTNTNHWNTLILASLIFRNFQMFDQLIFCEFLVLSVFMMNFHFSTPIFSLLQLS